MGSCSNSWLVAVLVAVGLVSPAGVSAAWADRADTEAREAAAEEARPSKPSGKIVLQPNHFPDETYTVNIYREDGRFDDAALAKLDRAFRCRRTGNLRAVDPRLYEMLSRIYDHYRKPIILISGHRYQRNVKSRHFHAAAADIKIEGVSTRKLYKFADKLDPGGMGIGRYPRSGFVHIDFRAPGSDSYRWTDYSGPGKKKKKRKKRPKRRRKPVS